MTKQETHEEKFLKIEGIWSRKIHLQKQNNNNIKTFKNI